jgi:D-beta-D-heptose 7-phosphate kinase/D-beta-D-heptose 1-phosphate adenosyltransferase
VTDSNFGRLLDRAAAVALAENLRSQDRRLVFTNGVFDIIHAGHVAYLQTARSFADFLLVGLNADTSVRTLKGPGRPLVGEADRAAVLLALRPVDAVVIFSETTAAALIEAIRPAIYVKGGDYALAGRDAGTPLPEEPIVRGYGGEIRLLPYLPGHSTSDLLAKIRDTA